MEFEMYFKMKLRITDDKHITISSIYLNRLKYGFTEWRDDAVIRKPIGTFITDFLETDFTKLDTFTSFINKWGISGLYEVSPTVKDLLTNIVPSDFNEDILCQIIWKESSDKLNIIQILFNQYFNDCILPEPHAPTWAKNLDVQKRYYIINKDLTSNKYLFPDNAYSIEKYNNNISTVFNIETYDPIIEQTFIDIDDSRDIKKISRLMADEKVFFINDYYVYSFGSACYLEFRALIQNKIKINRCNYCNNYFFVDKSDTKYCNRVIKGETKSCQEIGPMKNFYRANKDEPANKIYLKEYNKRYKRIKNKASDTNLEYIQELNKRFKEWQRAASIMKAKAKKGEITHQEFEEWCKRKE